MEGADPPLRRYAAQPDVVLSQERDLYYANTLLGEGTSELAETLLGARRVMILAPELRALASCLYFGLTNLEGKQTLGQEYCGIDLVPSGRGGGRESSPLPRRPLQAYTFLRVAVPYLQERLREGWHGLRSLRDPFGSGGAAAALAAARARARARAAVAPPVGIAVSSGSGETAADRAGSSEEEEENVVPTEAAIGISSGETGGGARAPPLASRSARSSPPPVVAFLRRVLAWARRRRPAMSGVLEWALRLHLAAFYFDGRFANVAMRAVGARLAYTRPEQEAPRARYAVLGLLLLLQAAAEAATVSAETAERWRATARAALSEGFPRSTETEAACGEGGDPSNLGGELGDTALPPRVPAATRGRTPTDVALFPPSRRRCSLCMSNRENVAATPCGHLFCWECIVGWCQTNPECPLCRQPVVPQSIVCLYQYA
ncbi:unnamed protein product [Ectocarpus sp. 12 AP-2014]